MVVIHDFRISISEYHIRCRNNFFPELTGCPQPNCSYQGRLRRHGFYHRNAISFEGVFLIVIQRYLCPSCGHTVSVLPSFLTPRFQYSLLVIFACIEALALLKSTAAVVSRIHLAGFSPQHVRFYKARLLSNKTLCFLFLGLDSSSLSDFPAAVKRTGGIELFAASFFALWHRPFTAKLA